ncbi:glycoside hydrolase superfamily [Lasiosphaeria ovina]|uniref:Glycoside hydrolase superfamily n=1 Tax=Lasiosphaeria ovina TaxID=92902 RepID=A0AAE0KBE0_9PEZI|nr:glycoside hydrolase superfamily [Lasiosphaeria ovina]
MSFLAPRLAYYATLESEIKAFQARYGKKVLLGLGGAGSNLGLGSDAESLNFANTLWALFGPPGLVNHDLQPFGSATLDGFDLIRRPADALRLARHAPARALLHGREQGLLLSTAPSCSFPDPSTPLVYLLQANFVWVRFFNNAACEIGADGFADALRSWSEALEPGVAPQRDSSALRTRFFVGAPSWADAAPAAYGALGAQLKGLAVLAQQLKCAGFPNLGGLMLWDGPEGQQNVQGGLNILAWAKRGLWC